MALLESTIGKGLVAVAVGGAGYTVLESSGVIGQGNEEGESKKQRNVKVGGIPQGRGLSRGRGRGFGVPQTVKRQNITKKTVNVEEGDTNITRVTKVDNSPSSGSGGGGGGSIDLSDGIKKTGDDNDIIKDTDTGAVIRDASPNDSGTKKDSTDSGSGEKSDDETKKDDNGGSAPPIYSV